MNHHNMIIHVNIILIIIIEKVDAVSVTLNLILPNLDNFCSIWGQIIAMISASSLTVKCHETQQIGITDT